MVSRESETLTSVPIPGKCCEKCGKMAIPREGVSRGIVLFTVRQAVSDTGYGPLAQAIKYRRMPPHILTPDEAVCVMQLMDDAHRMAVELPVYGASSPKYSGTTSMC